MLCPINVNITDFNLSEYLPISTNNKNSADEFN